MAKPKRFRIHYDGGRVAQVVDLDHDEDISAIVRHIRYEHRAGSPPEITLTLHATAEIEATFDGAREIEIREGEE